jgi:hypothetical protein
LSLTNLFEPSSTSCRTWLHVPSQAVSVAAGLYRHIDRITFYKINRQNLGDTYVTGVASFLLRTSCSLNNQTNSKRKSFRHDR